MLPEIPATRILQFLHIIMRQPERIIGNLTQVRLFEFHTCINNRTDMYFEDFGEWVIGKHYDDIDVLFELRV